MVSVLPTLGAAVKALLLVILMSSILPSKKVALVPLFPILNTAAKVSVLLS